MENFFCQIRAIGRGYDHPTPLEFIHRFRILVFTKNFANINFPKNIEKDKINENVLSHDIGDFNSISEKFLNFEEK